MKKTIINSRLLCLMAALLLMVAVQAETYDITVAGTQVTSDNADNVLNDANRTVQFDATTNTLTLQNVEIDLSSISTPAVTCRYDQLTVLLKGDNIIRMNSANIPAFRYLGESETAQLTFAVEQNRNCSLEVTGAWLFNHLYNGYTVTNTFETEEETIGWHRYASGSTDTDKSVKIYYIAPVATIEMNISYGENSRTWASYYTEEMSLETPDGLEAYVVTSASTTGVTVQKIDYIPQSVPVLLKRTIDEITEPIIAKEYLGAEMETPTNQLQGTAESLPVAAIEGNAYVLYNDGFTRATSGSIPAHRAYLVLGGETANSRLNIIEETTGVAQCSMFSGQSSMVNGPRNATLSKREWSMVNVYDLQGRKVSGSKKGIYIVNYRKVMKK